MNYLRRAGLITGPSLLLTRHTHLGQIKSVLLGNFVQVGKGSKKGYHTFGTHVHERFLLHKTKLKLNAIEKRKADGMIKALDAHPVVQRLMQRTVCENTQRVIVEGINMQFTPDAVASIYTGLDLKTTACNDEKDFIEKAFGYGYFRQGITYMLLSSPILKEFYIIGITKNAPHKVFIVNILKHKEWIKYCLQELKFLIYFYKNYGNFKALEVKENVSANNRRSKGKDKEVQKVIEPKPRIVKINYRLKIGNRR